MDGGNYGEDVDDDGDDGSGGGGGYDDDDDDECYDDDDGGGGDDDGEDVDDGSGGGDDDDGEDVDDGSGGYDDDGDDDDDCNKFPGLRSHARSQRTSEMVQMTKDRKEKQRIKTDQSVSHNKDITQIRSEARQVRSARH